MNTETAGHPSVKHHCQHTDVCSSGIQLYYSTNTVEMRWHSRNSAARRSPHSACSRTANSSVLIAAASLRTDSTTAAHCSSSYRHIKTPFFIIHLRQQIVLHYRPTRCSSLYVNALFFTMPCIVLYWTHTSTQYSSTCTNTLFFTRSKILLLYTDTDTAFHYTHTHTSTQYSSPYTNTLSPCTDINILLFTIQAQWLCLSYTNNVLCHTNALFFTKAHTSTHKLISVFNHSILATMYLCKRYLFHTTPNHGSKNERQILLSNPIFTLVFFLTPIFCKKVTFCHALTDDLSPSAPANKRTFSDSKQNTWPYCFWKHQWSASGLCRLHCEFRLTWCCLLHLFKWAELSFICLLVRGQCRLPNPGKITAATTAAIPHPITVMCCLTVHLSIMLWRLLINFVKAGRETCTTKSIQVWYTLYPHSRDFIFCRVSPPNQKTKIPMGLMLRKY